MSANSVNYADIQYTGNNFYLLYQTPSSLAIGTGADLGSLVLSTFTIITNYDYYPSMKAANGLAYAAYVDYLNQTNLYIFSYNGNTNLIGAITNGGAKSSPSIAIQDANHIYVAVSEALGGTIITNYIRVYMYDGSAWSQLGGDLITGKMPSIDIAPDGTPYVASVDVFYGGGRITVQAFR